MITHHLVDFCGDAPAGKSANVFLVCQKQVFLASVVAWMVEDRGLICGCLDYLIEAA
jgi:hypothetical protein